MTILLATENLMTRAWLQGPCRKAGARVCSAASKAENPEVILVDLTAPEALGRIRSLRANYPSARMVAFGPHVESGLFRDARAAGADEALARGGVIARLAALLEKAP